MRFLKGLCIFNVFVLFSSCSNSTTQTYQKLQGHWHSVKHPLRITIDVEDSSVYLDRYSWQCLESKASLFDSKNNLALPAICGCGLEVQPVWKDFYFKGDTLVYLTKDLVNICVNVDTIKLLKSDPEVCKWRHYSLPIDLLINPPVALSKIENFDSIKRTFPAVMFIGGPKKVEWGTDPKIQVHDVFISVEDIPVFIFRSWDQNKPEEFLSVVLVMDSSVRKSFADSVINAIPKSDSIKLFRLVKAKDSDELGYERMN